MQFHFFAMQARFFAVWPGFFAVKLGGFAPQAEARDVQMRLCALKTSFCVKWMGTCAAMA